ncbi:MAG: hypothetical protein KAI18_04590, partial [Candidatus Aenigmarchaeota archaeon]|nr:hypothetical protein [Candidatus Aenigmarchaeota archaeon]
MGIINRTANISELESVYLELTGLSDKIKQYLNTPEDPASDNPYNTDYHLALIENYISHFNQKEELSVFEEMSLNKKLRKMNKSIKTETSKLIDLYNIPDMPFDSSYLESLRTKTKINSKNSIY